MLLPHTPERLVHDLAALGIQAGQPVMMHSSYKALGAMMGGPNTVIQAVLTALGDAGTLMMYVGWNDMPDFYDIPAEQHAIYRASHPPFDPRTARTVRDHGIIAECFRTWPNAQRSLNPEASMVALGAQAEYLTRDHPLNYGYGVDTPLHKLTQIGGKILLLGSPLGTVTLLHHAEAMAKMRHKNIVHHHCPILRDGQSVWVEMEDFDTSEPHADYRLGHMTRAYVAAGNGQQGMVADATCYLFDAADLVRFATAWLEERFG